VAPNLGRPRGSVKLEALNFSAGWHSRHWREAARTIDSVQAGGKQSVLRRSARAVWRCCSLRNFFALSAGGALALLPLIAVGPVSRSVSTLPYSPQYPHQAYGYQLALTRLQHNQPARAWIAAADLALQEPQAVALPFAKQAERASASEALGYAFNVPVGRRVAVTVASNAAATGELFVDLFRVSPLRRERLTGAFPGNRSEPLVVDVLEGGDYVLRVQPPLGVSADVDIDIETSALLAFPVEGVGRSAIWSAFGAERDGGRRAHRGVDIFAARGTPVLAATDGWVTRVETTRVGGNVVWMQPLFGNMRVYYAHLHEQWVEAGDFVLTGQPLGAVGNTGNAITTPPHLHFGVYVRQPGVRGGARDPAEFLR
jgi:murein DD-endopeptidase MepM/ murein hydrolase activator NlpD